MDADAIARGQARANAEARDALASARAALRRVPEYSVEGTATGKRLLVPTGAIARGLAAYFEGAYRRAHPDEFTKAGRPRRKRAAS